MSTGTNAGLVHRFHQALQQGDCDTLTGMFHPDFVFHPQIDSPRPAPQGSSTRRRSTSTPSPASA